jgi:hypothetical protein
MLCMVPLPRFAGEDQGGLPTSAGCAAGILPRSRGRGTGGAGGGGEGGLLDCDQRTVQTAVAKNVDGLKAKDANAMLFQPLSAAGVVRGLTRTIMRPTINFYTKADFGAEEVKNIRTDRVLAAKTQTCEAAAAQMGPEDDFGK